MRAASRRWPKPGATSAPWAPPLAITNCLNFANPQRPEIMGQIVGALEGMGDACRALDYPIVSGNVSLYNRSKATGGGGAICPPRHRRRGPDAGPHQDGHHQVQGARRNRVADRPEGSHLGQSLWLREIAGREEGARRRSCAGTRNGETVRQLIADGIATAVHDVPTAACWWLWPKWRWPRALA
jgi:phosphoribosylformylglycinamidine synthase